MQNLKTIGSLLGTFWAFLRESLLVYPKMGQNDPNFLSAPATSKILSKYFFWYKNIAYDLFYLMNISIFKKKFSLVLHRVSKIFGRFRVAIFEAKNLKVHTLQFFWKFVKVWGKAQLRIGILLTLLVFWVFLAQKAEN